MILKKIFLKLMINYVYSKTMENLRKRINVRLVNNAGDCKEIVPQVVKRFKNIVKRVKKIVIRRIVIIEKDCDN